MPLASRHFTYRSIIALGAALAIARVAPSHAEPAESFLAGGALAICSSYSVRACADGQAPSGRTTPSFTLAEARRKKALIELQDILDGDALKALRGELARTQRALGDGPHDAEALGDALHAACRKPRCAWQALDDNQRGAVQLSLQLPAAGYEGERLREAVALDASRDPAGPDILRAFVAAAAKRSPARRPRIAFVTASGFDPYDAVDFYRDALTQAGAEAVWWPIDAAAAATVFGDRDCEQLEARQRQLLGLPTRQRLFPDLVTEQQAWCRTEQSASLPVNLQGVFFAGGDQWKLRRSLFAADEQPTAWLQALRREHAAGRLVIAGTSAGTAIQSGPGMLSNGSPERALRDGPQQAVPPEAGCDRSARCGALQEDSFTVWPAGGLDTAGPFLMDTHFSERAREWRLLRALAAGPRAAGLGVDENSALHLRQRGPADIELRALGRAGGWLFEVGQRGCGALQGRAHYLAPGRTLRWNGQRIEAEPQRESAPMTAPSSAAAGSDPFAPGAVRAAMSEFAAGAPRWRSQAAGAELSLLRSVETEVWAGASVPGVIGLDFELRYPERCPAAP